VAGAMAMDVGQQIIKFRIGEYVWVHVGIEVTGLGKVEG
jgi:hydrogenase maturation factor